MIYVLGGITAVVLRVTGHHTAALVVACITLTVLAVYLVGVLAYIIGRPA